ncbi:MAG: outer membrane protein assembly factor BamD [Gallionella sp.]|nr:MAG: outer membrane protein assembly factor BamD [Gallionella sp.]
MSAETLYNEAKTELNEGNYEAAIKQYETLQSRYPYGRYAQQALLETAYAHYRQNEAESAISTADRFIKQYPNNPHVDYAYYLKGLVNFNDDAGILRTATGQDPTERDPKASQDSFSAFKDLVTRFPNSKYAPDSRLRMQYLVNALAKYELHVAGYYLRRGAHIAAANRAQGVLTQYPNSPSTRDALEILAQAYDAMGMADLRDDARRVLAKNTGASAPSPAGNATAAGKTTPEKAWWQFWR